MSLRTHQRKIRVIFMKILIATGIYPPEIGGPAQYALNLEKEFLRKGHSVKVLTYRLERKLPGGLRHFLYFLRVIFSLKGVTFILALDTFSVGLPSVLAARLLRKKIIVRVGGDFLWESYIERRGEMIPLVRFYTAGRDFDFKEKAIFQLTKFLLHKCDAVAFSTVWQRDIFVPAYSLNKKETHVIENFYGEKKSSNIFQKKNFLWAGRPLLLKNIALLKSAFIEAKVVNPGISLEIGQFPHDVLMDRIKNCYAVILPSISEVSPNFILDALRFNKPFILTKETGFYEKLKGIGIFVDPLDKEDIKSKILFLADDSNYVEYKKRVASFRFAHSWQEIVDEFLALYKTL